MPMAKLEELRSRGRWNATNDDGGPQDSAAPGGGFSAPKVGRRASGQGHNGRLSAKALVKRVGVFPPDIF